MGADSSQCLSIRKCSDMTVCMTGWLVLESYKCGYKMKNICELPEYESEKQRCWMNWETCKHSCFHVFYFKVNKCFIHIYKRLLFEKQVHPCRCWLQGCAAGVVGVKGFLMDLLINADHFYRPLQGTYEIWVAVSTAAFSRSFMSAVMTELICIVSHSNMQLYVSV